MTDRSPMFLQRIPASVRPLIVGVVAAGLAWHTLGWVHGCIVLVIAMCFATAGPGTIGTPITGGVSIDPKAVRRHREDNPGATTTEAIAALHR